MHLKNIEIENFRVFADRAEFEFRPITILTGKNNSGKSSLNKFLWLLKENRGNGLNNLHFSQSSGLKSFINCFPWSKEKEPKEMSIVLDFPLDYFKGDYSIELIYKSPDPNQEQGSLVRFKIFRKEDSLEVFNFVNNAKLDEDGFTMYSQTLWNLNPFFEELFDKAKVARENKKDQDEKVKKWKEEQRKKGMSEDQILNFGFFQNAEPYYSNGEINNCFSNFDKDHSLKTLLSASSLVDLFEDKLLFDYYHEGNKMDLENHSELIELEKSLLIYGQQKSFDHFDLLENDIKGSTEKFLYEFNPISTISYGVERETERILGSEGIKVELNESLKKIQSELLEKGLQNAFKKMKTPFNLISKMTSTRGSHNRLLSNESENSEIDLVARVFKDNFLTGINHSNLFEEFLDRQLERFDIDGKIVIDRIENVASAVYIKPTGTDKKILLTDLGFGYSQLIPIVMKIMNIAADSYLSGDQWNEEHFLNSIFILEEPEANLHPNYQSNIADLLIDAARTFNMQFIVETHSEYLIRKFQYLTAKNEIEPKDTVLYYFTNPNKVEKEENQIKKINILNTGGLNDNFGSGFYDEAINLQFDLLKLNQAQEN